MPDDFNPEDKKSLSLRVPDEDDLIRSTPKRLVHLLIPKQFRVWCRPDVVPGDFDVTTVPVKATCANCLTRFKRNKTGKKGRFFVKDILR